MRCPGCQKETEFAGNPFRPFCSERCKLIDLGSWAAGRYRVPTQERPAEEEMDEIQKSNGHLEEEDGD